nr:hypothetical protein CFP56_57699 [Quercus suber]
MNPITGCDAGRKEFDSKTPADRLFRCCLELQYIHAKHGTRAVRTARQQRTLQHPQRCVAAPLERLLSRRATARGFGSFEAMLNGDGC